QATSRSTPRLVSSAPSHEKMAQAIAPATRATPAFKCFGPGMGDLLKGPPRLPDVNRKRPRRADSVIAFASRRHVAPQGHVIRGLGLMLAVLASATVAGCSHTAPAAKGPEVDVSMKDFRLVSSTKQVRAGEVTFVVANHGPSTHEFNVDRTARRA